VENVSKILRFFFQSLYFRTVFNHPRIMTTSGNTDEHFLERKENQKVENFNEEENTKCGFWIFNSKKIQV
jgi:hypothetical protein